MRFPISLLLLGVLAVNSSQSQAAPARKIVPKGAVSFTSKVQGFAVWFPVKPVQRKRVISSQKGKAFTIFETEAGSKAIAYDVLVIAKSPRMGSLNAIQQEISKSFSAKLQKREEILLDDFPGREVKLGWSFGRGTVRARFYATPKMSYVVCAVGPKDVMKNQAAQITRVFDSFRILPQ